MPVITHDEHGDAIVRKKDVAYSTAIRGISRATIINWHWYRIMAVAANYAARTDMATIDKND